MRISCIIAFCFTAKHINSKGGGTVKLEVFYPLKHWQSPTDLNGVKSWKTTLCGKMCVHLNIFPAPVLSNSHFDIHNVLTNIITLLHCCMRNEHMQTCWVFLLFTLHKILHQIVYLIWRTALVTKRQGYPLIKWPLQQRVPLSLQYLQRCCHVSASPLTHAVQSQFNP